MAAKRWLVIGIGNPDRSDDGAGHEVVRLLTGRAPAGVELLCHRGEATALLGRLQRADAAWLIDAAASGVTPGTIRRFDAVAGALPSGLDAVSSHGLGLAQLIELARTLAALPHVCIVYAIEGGHFIAGAPLSPAVARAATTVADRILYELKSSRFNGGPNSSAPASAV